MLLRGGSYTNPDHYISQNRTSIPSNSSSSHAVFISSESDNYSLIIDGKAIGVHAICRSPDIYARPCVYCQLSDPQQDTWNQIGYSPGCELEGEIEDCDELDSNCSMIDEVLFSPIDENQCIPFSIIFLDSVVYSLFEVLSDIQVEERGITSNMEEEDFFEAGGEIAFECNVDQLFMSG